MKHLINSLFLLIFLTSCSNGIFKEIKPCDESINYTGRYYFKDSENAISDWSGTCFRCRFTGKKLGIKLEGSGDVQFNVFIDRQPVKIISCNSGETIWVDDSLRSGQHTLRVYRRTESFLGIAVFKGLVIDSHAKVLPWKDIPGRRIEFIGNSITCGYGVEGASRHDDFKVATENNYLTYAAILGRTFNADYSIIAHSGLGIVRHYGDSLKVSADPQMPSRYLRTLDNNDTIRWDFSSWKPDIVMINLGTNDFSTLPYPEKEVFQAEYEKLVRTVREKYGEVHIFCVSGPLIGDPCTSYVKEIVEIVRQKYSDENIFFIGIPKDLLNCDEDFGSDEHPSIKGQQKIAECIATVVSKELGWEYSSIVK